MQDGGQACLRAVVFDLGGVLVEWDPRRLYRKLFAETAEMEWFLANVCTPAWNAELDRGRPFTEAVADLTTAHPAYATEIDAYRTRWDEMLGDEIEGTARMVSTVQARGVPAYALTNWSAETYPIARARFASFDLFDGIVVSGHVGVVKPEREIFDLVRERFGLVPATTLFVDDSEVNVRAAAELGFRTHHFRTPSHLREELATAGLL
ncbi:MAG: HAD family phosphatase [Acidimicrobiia bacterium]|nr:HAD family phosphatase [Acidimicrobiia bacterium]